MVEFLSQPWPWYVAGPLITLIMLGMLFFGKTFGVSSTLRTMCAAGGAGKAASFFKFDWKGQLWNIVFIGGAVIGGFISFQFLKNPDPIALNPATSVELQQMGIANPGAEYLPSELFSWESLTSWQGILLLIGGGFLVGFGARYAGGCTSGHAISGLSNLQVPSLVAVIGFFIGGLISTWYILPQILGNG